MWQILLIFGLEIPRSSLVSCVTSKEHFTIRLLPLIKLFYRPSRPESLIPIKESSVCKVLTGSSCQSQFELFRLSTDLENRLVPPIELGTVLLGNTVCFKPLLVA